MARCCIQKQTKQTMLNRKTWSVSSCQTFLYPTSFLQPSLSRIDCRLTPQTSLPLGLELAACVRLQKLSYHVIGVEPRYQDCGKRCRQIFDLSLTIGCMKQLSNYSVRVRLCIYAILISTSRALAAVQTWKIRCWLSQPTAFMGCNT